MDRFKKGDIVRCIQSDGGPSGRYGAYIKNRRYKVLYYYEDGFYSRIDTECLLTGEKNGWAVQFFVLDREYIVEKILKEVLNDPNPQ